MLILKNKPSPKPKKWIFLFLLVFGLFGGLLSLSSVPLAGQSGGGGVLAEQITNGCSSPGSQYYLHQASNTVYDCDTRDALSLCADLRTGLPGSTSPNSCYRLQLNVCPGSFDDNPDNDFVFVDNLAAKSNLANYRICIAAPGSHPSGPGFTCDDEFVIQVNGDSDLSNDIVLKEVDPDLGQVCFIEQIPADGGNCSILGGITGGPRPAKLQPGSGDIYKEINPEDFGQCYRRDLQRPLSICPLTTLELVTFMRQPIGSISGAEAQDLYPRAQNTGQPLHICMRVINRPTECPDSSEAVAVAADVECRVSMPRPTSCDTGYILDSSNFRECQKQDSAVVGPDTMDANLENCDAGFTASTVDEYICLGIATMQRSECPGSIDENGNLLSARNLLLATTGFPLAVDIGGNWQRLSGDNAQGPVPQPIADTGDLSLTGVPSLTVAPTPRQERCARLYTDLAVFECVNSNHKPLSDLSMSTAGSCWVEQSRPIVPCFGSTTAIDTSEDGRVDMCVELINRPCPQGFRLGAASRNREDTCEGIRNPNLEPSVYEACPRSHPYLVINTGILTLQDFQVIGGQVIHKEVLPTSRVPITSHFCGIFKWPIPCPESAPASLGVDSCGAPPSSSGEPTYGRDGVPNGCESPLSILWTADRGLGAPVNSRSISVCVPRASEPVCENTALVEYGARCYREISPPRICRAAGTFVRYIGLSGTLAPPICTERIVEGLTCDRNYALISLEGICIHDDVENCDETTGLTRDKITGICVGIDPKPRPDECSGEFSTVLSAESCGKKLDPAKDSIIICGEGNLVVRNHPGGIDDGCYEPVSYVCPTLQQVYTGEQYGIRQHFCYETMNPSGPDNECPSGFAESLPYEGEEEIPFLCGKRTGNGNAGLRVRRPNCTSSVPGSCHFVIGELSRLTTCNVAEGYPRDGFVLVNLKDGSQNRNTVPESCLSAVEREYRCSDETPADISKPEIGEPFCVRNNAGIERERPSIPLSCPEDLPFVYEPRFYENYANRDLCSSINPNEFALVKTLITRPSCADEARGYVFLDPDYIINAEIPPVGQYEDIAIDGTCGTFITEACVDPNPESQVRYLLKVVNGRPTCFEIQPRNIVCPDGFLKTIEDGIEGCSSAIVLNEDLDLLSLEGLATCSRSAISGLNEQGSSQGNINSGTSTFFRIPFNLNLNVTKASAVTKFLDRYLVNEPVDISARGEQDQFFCFRVEEIEPKPAAPPSGGEELMPESEDNLPEFENRVLRFQRVLTRIQVTELRPFPNPSVWEQDSSAMDEEENRAKRDEQDIAAGLAGDGPVSLGFWNSLEPEQIGAIYSSWGDPDGGESICRPRTEEYPDTEAEESVYRPQRCNFEGDGTFTFKRSTWYRIRAISTWQICRMMPVEERESDEDSGSLRDNFVLEKWQVDPGSDCPAVDESAPVSIVGTRQSTSMVVAVGEIQSQSGGQPQPQN